MPRIDQIDLKNFRGYREKDNSTYHSISTGADIVLITGKNGSGKTSLFQAITLLLNGYDENIFKGRHFNNLHSASKTSTLALKGIPGIDKTLEKSNKDWQKWQSPFELNREMLGASLARVATAYFQGQVEELANGDFLNYLTGTGNQGQQVLEWVKIKGIKWKELADDSLPSEKNWDVERKEILFRVKAVQQKTSSDSGFVSLFKDFEPFINNGNLAKHWQSQVINLAVRFGVLESIYGFALLDEFRKQVKKKINELEEEQKKKFEDRKTRVHLLSKLKDLLSSSDETIDLVPQASWGELEAKQEKIETLLKLLTDEQKKLKQSEPRTNALDHILGVLSEETEEAHLESKRLASTDIPLSPNVVSFVETLNKFDYQELGDDYNSWRNMVSTKLEKIASQIKAQFLKLEQLKRQLDILRLLKEIPETQKFLGAAKTIHSSLILQELEPDAKYDIEKSEAGTRVAAMNEFEQAVLSLIKLEHEYEKHDQEKRQMQSFVKAKTYAGEWATTFAKESGAGGTLLKVMNEMDLDPVIDALSNILSMFQLPPDFVEDVQFRRKGTGRNATLVPALGKVDFENLSTGQKTLFALAWTTVLNLSFHGKLGHSVMLFDDITTSLDLNQISPACLLFRKLAYSSDDEKRRQLFISSHHEDLTNKLIDNLIPPVGRSMKVLEIQDFTIENGPLIDAWNVAPAKVGSF